MAEKGENANQSGLTPEQVNRQLARLMADWRVKACIAAKDAGQRADIGFFVKSSEPFYRDGKPLGPGFAPNMFVEGDGGGPILAPADAAKLRKSRAGYTALHTCDLSQERNIEDYFRNILTESGSVELAPQFTPTLTRSIAYIAADPDTLKKPPINRAYDGTNITVCVVDMGCDFTHRNFRRADGQTRLTFLAVVPPTGTPQRYNSNTINGWINSSDPFTVYDPHADEYNCTPVGDEGTHGTLVLDIAAGNGNGTGAKGVAPNANLCFVQPYVSETGGRRYISGEALYACLSYVTQQLAAPVIVNVSLGTNEGPHDPIDHGTLAGGNLAWNIRINQLFNNAQGLALVWSAGNQNRTDAHVAGKVRNNKQATLDVRVPKGDQRVNPIKVWYDEPSASVTLRAQATLLAYKGAPSPYNPTAQAGPTPLGTTSFDLFDEHNRVAGNIGVQTKYSSSAADWLFSLEATLIPPVLRTPSRPGDEDRWETWRLELIGSSTAAFNIPFDAWIERDDGDQPRFIRPVMTGGANPHADISPLTTLSGAAAGIANAIVVGAVGCATYVPGTPFDSVGVGAVMPFSSSGPTRLALEQNGVRTRELRPDVCAPGEIVSGAKSKGDPVALGTGWGKAAMTLMSGTSMAAPHVAGVIALLFDKYRRAGTAYPTPADLRALLKQAARPILPGSTAPQWDPQRGHGCIDAVRLLST